MDDDGGDYSTDKISAGLITKDTKRPAKLQPVARMLPERKPFGKVLIRVLLVCRFTETKKRLLNALQKTPLEKIIPSNSAVNADQMDF